MQVVVGALVVIVGLTLAVTGWLGRRGALRRNRFVGIRTATTMASDEAFRIGNQVAGPVLVAAGAVAVLGGLAAIPARTGPAFGVVLGVVAAGVIGLSLAGGVLGARAAAAAASPPPRRCAGCACGGPGSSSCAG